MGISGLLQLSEVDRSMTPIYNLEKEFGNKVAAVDGHGWLHKSLPESYPSIYLNEPGQDYFVEKFMRSVNYLRVNKIIPLIVFDGMKLPAKHETNAKRKLLRLEVIAKVKELIASGDENDARKKLKQCVEVTQEIVMKVVKKLREEKIPYLISPYESDAQLTHLVNNNFVDFVISEDSDLIPYGADKVLFKFNRPDPRSKSMCNMLYEKSKLLKVDPLFPDLTAWRRMCIISGCDYLSNIPGIGLQKAKIFMTAFQKLHLVSSQSSAASSPPDFYEYLKQLPLVLRKNVLVSDDYIGRFKEAELTFQFQLVYDLKCKKMVPLNPYNGTVHDGKTINILNLPCAGKSLSPELSYHHSLGNLNNTHDSVIPEITFNPGRKWLCDIKNELKFLIENVGYNLSSSPVVASPRTPSILPCSPLCTSQYFTDSKTPTSNSNKRKSISPEETPKRGRKYRGFGDCPFLPKSDSLGKTLKLSSQGSSLNSSFDSFTGSP